MVVRTLRIVRLGWWPLMRIVVGDEFGEREWRYEANEVRTRRLDP